jgi:hypothetical protein
MDTHYRGWRPSPLVAVVPSIRHRVWPRFREEIQAESKKREKERKRDRRLSLSMGPQAKRLKAKTLFASDMMLASARGSGWE